MKHFITLEGRSYYTCGWLLHLREEIITFVGVITSFENYYTCGCNKPSLVTSFQSIP
jgi:hypothetical protein